MHLGAVWLHHGNTGVTGVLVCFVLVHVCCGVCVVCVCLFVVVFVCVCCSVCVCAVELMTAVRELLWKNTPPPHHPDPPPTPHPHTTVPLVSCRQQKAFCLTVELLHVCLLPREYGWSSLERQQAEQVQPHILGVEEKTALTVRLICYIQCRYTHTHTHLC